MRCPFCNFEESKVVDSRSSEDKSAIRRRRECLKCNKRYTTYEKVENIPILIIKRNKDRENFDRNKLLNGLIRACEKRPVSRKILEEVADDIEKKLYNQMRTEVQSQYLGELVMEKLKEIDEIAYVRFASVYRQFKDIDSFMEEIAALKKKS
ncbi:transcriptional regulator NrdR [Oceanirhabdus sp. W0125-5]|uniref:transcriptional regulator NrdR n=1 Tax=Oceanirhabdus sp. W0125-5 TaxID=2999116 RepID=UPI0022F2BFFD|nr:transcriptional regulator NrdR [Oceanirhabdus sp. W0125-5]WBW99627.1 transcriptional regulator NrdR [Oceanirhabdus sp. W0125-5]